MEFLISVVVWMLAVYGTALIVSMSTLFEPARRWLLYSSYLESGGNITVVERKFQLLGKLVSCIMCMGFWSGVFWGGMFFDPAGLVEANTFMHLLFNGVLGAASTWVIHANLINKTKGL
tara:strand:+ start:1199 stop:1555 length:357 start_codon:yes stop_codon:yes gene_type:complete